MTVILQTPFKGQNPGTEYTGPEEAMLVANGLASLIGTTDADKGTIAFSILRGNGSASDKAAFAGAVDEAGRLGGKPIGGNRADIPWPLKAKSSVIAAAPTGVKVAGQWGVAFTGTALSIDAVNVRRPGVPVLKYSDNTASGNAGFDYIMRNVTTASAAEGKIELWVYIPQSAGASNVNIILSSDTPGGNPPPAALPTNYLKATIPNTYFMRDTWTCITLNLASSVATYSLNTGPITWQVVGAPSRTTIQQLRYELNFASSGITGQRYMLFDETGMGGRSVPFAMFTFDGYVTETVRLAKPIFDKYGFRAAMCVDGNNVAAGLIPLQRLHDSGWDIIMQGNGHQSYVGNATKLGTDIDSCRAILTAQGFTSALDCFAWPVGSSDVAARSMARSKGIKWARESNLPRTIYSSLGSSLDHTCNVGAFDLGQAASQQAMLDTLTEAITCGDSTTFLGHEAITSGTPNALQYRTTDLDAILSLAAEQQKMGKCVVGTPSEYLRAIGL